MTKKKKLTTNEINKILYDICLVGYKKFIRSHDFYRLADKLCEHGEIECTKLVWEWTDWRYECGDVERWILSRIKKKFRQED